MIKLTFDDHLGQPVGPVQGGVHAQLIVMVVDDLLKVPRVTQRLQALESYQVVLAKDAIDALEHLHVGEVRSDAGRDLDVDQHGNHHDHVAHGCQAAQLTLLSSFTSTST